MPGVSKEGAALKIAALAVIFGTAFPASFAVAQPAVGKVGLAGA
jgi:hypothetical protein